MNICRQCKNRILKTFYIYGLSDHAHIKTKDCCLTKILKDPIIDPVTGEKTEREYEECRFINQTGNCPDFIKKSPFWKFW